MRKALIFTLASMMFGCAMAADISGELKQWHRLTLTFEGPESGELTSANPFMEYRLLRNKMGLTLGLPRSEIALFSCL